METIGLDTIAWAFGSLSLVVLAGFLVRYIVAMQSRPTVKHLSVMSPVVMSRSTPEADRLSASFLQTDGGQCSDRRTIPQPTPDQMLDIFKVLRAAGVKRDKLATAWRAAGLPLDNTLWARAMPPEPAEPQYTTPIAGRPTVAAFETDPELRFEQPPA